MNIAQPQYWNLYAKVDHTHSGFKKYDKSSSIHFLKPPPDKPGDCSVIKATDGQIIMIDCGEVGSFDSIVSQLNVLNIHHIDILLITHSHSDHIGESVNIIKKYKPNRLICKTVDFDQLPDIEIDWNTKELHYAMINCAKLNGCLVESAVDCNIYINENEYIKVLGSDYINYSDYNHNSLMFVYKYSGSSVCFAGDTTFETESYLSGKIGSVDVLKCGHHGTNSSTGINFVSELRPRYSLFGHYIVYDLFGAKEVAKRCQWYFSECFDIYETNPGCSLEVFPGGVIKHSLINSNVVNDWFFINNKYAYFSEIGKPVINRIIQHGTSYYSFDSSYYLQTDCFIPMNDFGDYYYADSNGRFLSFKWLVYNNDYYWFKNNFVMARNEDLYIDGKFYNFNDSGVCTNPHQ